MPSRSSLRDLHCAVTESRLRNWLRSAAERSIVRRALITTAIVGTILTIINHGGAIVAGELTRARLFQICLTFVVPYAVSTTSSVAATRLRR